MRKPRSFDINKPRLMGETYTPLQAALDRLLWRRSVRSQNLFYKIRKLGSGPMMEIDQSWRTIDESLPGVASEWWDPFQGFTPGIGTPRRSLESVAAEMMYSYRGERAEAAFMDYGLHIPGFALGEKGEANLGLWKRKAIKFRAEKYFQQIDPRSYGKSFLERSLDIARGKGKYRGSKYYDVLLNPYTQAKIEVQGSSEEQLKKRQREGDLSRAKLEARRAAEGVEAPNVADYTFAPGEEAALHTKEEIADYSARINASDLSAEEKARWIEEYKNEGQRASVKESAMAADTGVTTAEGNLISQYRVKQSTIARQVAGSEHETLSHGRMTDFGTIIDKPSAGGSTLLDREYDWSARAFDQSATFYHLEQGKNFYSFGEADLTGLKISLADKVSKSQTNELLGLSGVSLEEKMSGAEEFFSKFDAFAQASQQLDARSIQRGARILGEELKELNIFPDRIAKMKVLSKKLSVASKIRNKTTRLLETQSILNEINALVVSPIKDKMKEVLRWSEGRSIEGYEGLKELLNTAEVGTVFRAEQGGKTGNVVVDYLSNAGGMDILLTPNERAGIAPGTVVKKRVLDAAYDEARLAKFEKAGYRNPVTLYGVKTPITVGKKSFPHAISLYFPGGDFAGYVENAAAQRLSGQGGMFENIKSGFVGEFTADILDSGKSAKLSMQAFDEAGSAINQSLGVVKGITRKDKGKTLLIEDPATGLPVQDAWRRAWRGDKNLITADATSRMVAETFHRRIATSELALEKAAARSSKLTEKTAGKGWVIGASLAAGALLLYGASRLARNNAPITPGDVQTSLYGDVGMGGGGMGPVHTPIARVIQNNNGFSTNIDVEATDRGGNVDYRAMAGSLSSMSGASLGVGRVNTSLHVVDDSNRMDRESIKRSINQQLSV